MSSDVELTKKQKRDLSFISNFAEKKEKTSWKRKHVKMLELIDELNEVQDEILKLMEKKNALSEEITQLKDVMVSECIHPIEELVHYDTFVRCKFCGSKLLVINDKK